jgi:enoyl-CoA hydratase
MTGSSMYAGVATEGLVVEVRDRVAYLCIDRPQRRNALSMGLTHALISTFAAIATDEDIWAVTITGQGEKAFCAGTDLKELDAIAREGGAGFPVPMRGVERNLFEVILEVGKPTVAAVNGVAMGAGSEIALACDIRLFADHAILAQSEAKRGMGANFASVVLPRLLPRGLAFELLYTGEPLTAQAALAWGLANRVVPGADLEAETERMVRSIVANAPLSVQRYKHMFTKGWEMPIHQALRLDAGPDPYTSHDRREGIRAFNEKRPPRWEGR